MQINTLTRHLTKTSPKYTPSEKLLFLENPAALAFSNKVPQSTLFWPNKFGSTIHLKAKGPSISEHFYF